MAAVFTSLVRALGQLADPAVLRVLAKSLGVTVLVFLVVATAGWFAFDWLLARAGLADSRFAGAEGLRGAASLLLALAGLWLVWRVVAMAVIQFYAEDVVRAVEARFYPQAASAARDLPLGEQVKAGLGSAGRATVFNLAALPFALLLLVTGIGPALLFWAVNALLVGRDLQDMVWLRHRHSGDSQGPALCPVSRWERLALGGVVAALLVVPFANFIAPVLGAAGAAHLVHRPRPARSSGN
jgi:CysZ protein